jgi:hypothetical protein
VPQADAAFDDMDNPIPNAVANALRLELARLVDMARMMA